MTETEWKKLTELIKTKSQALGEEKETLPDGQVKEVLTVRGERGQTRFERYTRPNISDAPPDLFKEEEYPFNAVAMASYIRVWRRTDPKADWQEIRLEEVLGLPRYEGEVFSPSSLDESLGRGQKPRRRHK